MNSKVLKAINLIGGQLDQGVLPRVGIGGLIKPAIVNDVSEQAGAEKQDETHRSRRSSAGSWQGPPRRQGQARRSRTAGRSRPAASGAPALCSSHEATYRSQKAALIEAYPQLTIEDYDTHMWLFLRSPILSGLPRTAAILVFVPFRAAAWPSAWAYWDDGSTRQWIGPQHTNFQDGSICTLDREDGTWYPGGYLVTLLDLYCLWVFRHLYLQVSGRWPGSQSVSHPFERLAESHDDEMCGCSLNRFRYVECCKPDDLALDLILISRDFQLKYGDLQGRKPPPIVEKFFSTLTELPADSL